MKRKGGCFAAGFRSIATGDVVLVQDADLESMIPKDYGENFWNPFLTAGLTWYMAPDSWEAPQRVHYFWHYA